MPYDHEKRYFMVNQCAKLQEATLVQRKYRISKTIPESLWSETDQFGRAQRKFQEIEKFQKEDLKNHFLNLEKSLELVISEGVDNIEHLLK